MSCSTSIRTPACAHYRSAGSPALVVACLFLGSLAALPAAGAQAPARVAIGADSLTLDSLYRLVATRSPRVQAAQALARAAAARVPGASRPADPEVQLGFMNYSLPRLAPDPTLGMTQLQLMQMVPTPGKLGAAGSAARARADAARARADDAGWLAWSEATMAFYEVYQVAGAVVIARETRRLLDDVAAVATAMYRVAEGRQADVLRARVEIARMDEEVVRMEAMLDAARARLAAAVDTSADAMAATPVLPAFPDSVPTLDQLEQLAFASRPMLLAGQADIRAAEFDATLARRELWPDLQVGLQYSQRRMEMGVDRMGSLMLGASIPIFARSRQLRMRDETLAMRQMAEAELAAMRAETRASLAAIRVTLLSTRRLRTLYRMDVLPQANAATTSSLASYRTGGVDFMTVIENRMSVNRYLQELLVLDAAEGRAWAELEMLVGRPIITPTRGNR